jgi:hypothetical protein
VASLLNYFVRGARAVVHAIEDLLDDIADDTFVQRGLEADLGLPQGALDRKKVKPPPITRRGVRQAVDADAEKLRSQSTRSRRTRVLTDVFDAAETEDPSIVASEALYRMFEWATVDLMKFEHRTSTRDAAAADLTYDVRTRGSRRRCARIGRGLFTEDFWKTVGQSYVNFRLDQAPDFVSAPIRRTEPERRRAASSCTSSAAECSLSDLVRRPGPDPLPAALRRQEPAARPDLRLGGRTAGATDAVSRPAERPASRSPTTREPRLTTRLKVAQSGNETTTATLTQLLLEDLDAVASAGCCHCAARSSSPRRQAH